MFFNIPITGNYAYYTKAISDDDADIFRVEMPLRVMPKDVIIVKGTLRNKETGEPIEAKIIYERLPEGVTVGTTKSYAETGEYVWSYEIGERVTSSPTVANGHVFIGSLDGKLYCLDAFNGNYFWDYATFGSISYSSAAVVGDKVYFGSCDSNVYCIDTDGNFIWSFSTGAAVRSSPAVAYGNVYIGSYDNTVYCLNAEGNGDGTTTEIWNYTTNSWVFSSPGVADGKVYVGSRDGTFYCFNNATGDLIWMYYADGIYPPVGGIGSSPAIANGKVYVASTSGHLYAFGDLVLKAKAISRFKSR